MAKVLFMTHSPIPDNRIDRETLTLISEGHEVYIIYPSSKGNVPSHFKQSYQIPISKRVFSLLPFASQKYAKKVKLVINEVHPDIIHAHDIVAANIARLIKTKEKFVYDDHEIWEIYLRNRMKEAKGGFNKLKKWLFYFREKQVFPKVRDKIDLLIVINHFWEDYYRKRKVTSDIITLENFPSKKLIDNVLSDKISVEEFFTKDQRKKVIHTTNMKISSDVVRNVISIAEAVNELPDWMLVVFGPEDENYIGKSVKFFQKRPLEEFLACCAKCTIGANLMPIYNDWYNYISSNRIFELTTLGLNLFSTKVKTLMDKFGENFIWVDEKIEKEEVIKILEKIDNYPLGSKMREIAKNFFWEKQEKKLVSSYEKLLTK
ncbi:MAG TPA: glycosyltransferase [Candidatus Bathyarchaeia archaeon]|nr:glycosyltransferase [Candidatus Bathyarchaeia archaeon]